MSDNHFTYLHMTPMQLRMLDADDDPCIHEPLPDEGELQSELCAKQLRSILTLL